MAVAGNKVLSWINKPSIRMFVEKNSNCYIEHVKEQLEDSNEEESIIIRTKIVNKGNTIAKNAVVLVEEVYKENGEGVFKKYKEFVPHNIHFSNTGHNINDHCSDLIPNLSYYIHVAKIQKISTKSLNENDGYNKQNYKLYLLIDESISKKELGSGTFIVPIKIYSETLKEPIIFYLRIHWSSVSLNPNEVTLKLEDKQSIKFQ